MPVNKYPTMSVSHVQQEAAKTWVIDHGQHGYPVVDVYINVNGAVQKIMPLGVEYVNENTVNILFSEARSGFATVVV